VKKLKKLSLKERNRLIARYRRYTKRTFKRKKISKSNDRIDVENIDLPSNFNLHENTDETLKIMNDFRAKVNGNHRLKSLNFQEMQHIDSSSALMLVAEIDVWNEKIGRALSPNHKTWDTRIKALLCEMGFFELLKMPPLEEKQKIDKEIIFLKFISGHKSEGEKAKELKEKIEEVIGKELERRTHLYEGLTEAFTNTAQHAYNKKPCRYDKWWITAAYKESEGKLVVSMYDRGKSIPKTLHKHDKWNQIKSYLSGDIMKKHTDLIEAAMRVSFEQKGGSKTRTQTQKTNRGKGLKQLLDFTKEGGRLTIISGKGYCVFDLNDNKLTTKKRKSLKYPLEGTLIEWKIDL